MTNKIKTVEEWLKNVSYKDEIGYIPSDFALEFVNFIKLVNGGIGEEHKTPVLHYKMLKDIASKKREIANMVFRGAAKTSLAEYLFLYLGVYGVLPEFGKITLALYVSDSIENGVKNMRKNLEFRWENSEFLRNYIPEIKFTDIRWEFKNVDGNIFIVKGYGGRALSLDSVLFAKEGKTTIRDCAVGDFIYGADGELAAIVQKSEIFNKPMYQLKLKDGRSIKVSEDHINSVVINTTPNGVTNWVDKNLTTKELLDIKLTHAKLGNKNHSGTSTKSLVYVRNCSPIRYKEKEFKIDPYTLGLILGNGSVKKNGNGVIITGLKEDYLEYKKIIPYELGNPHLDKRTKAVVSWAIKDINTEIYNLYGDHKFIPEKYFYGSVAQRMWLLKGLLDTNGNIYDSGRISFYSNSHRLCEDTANLVRSLGGKAYIKHKVKNKNNFITLEIWINECPFNLPRKAIRFIKDRQHWDKSAITSITRIADEPSQCIAINNTSKQFITGEYFRTHNTGVRGSKEQGTRPMLAVLDDLVSDSDARSDTVIASIEDTIYKAVDFALHPTRSKIIWSGTPFNARDPLYKAIESGAWSVNVYPVCEHFPCEEKDFISAWPDRFTFDYVNDKYNKAVALGKIDTFNQELMLRIMSEEDRLILDENINWYNRESVLRNMSSFNFYITTDFATSESTSSDYSVIAVWALNNKGYWFWVDGVCKKQTMDINIDDLFKLSQKYNPQQVGIEVSGQQGGFISWIQREMIDRNIWFNLASEDNKGKPGIRPNTNKMVRFNIVVPWFKANKMYFPTEMKDTPIIQEYINELQLIAPNSMRSKHDDCIDTISMLASLIVWRPSENVNLHKDKSNIWTLDEDRNDNIRLHSYIV
jgi:predicted phage terminase large subunit-like protein